MRINSDHQPSEAPILTDAAGRRIPVQPTSDNVGGALPNLHRVETGTGAISPRAQQAMAAGLGIDDVRHISASHEANVRPPGRSCRRAQRGGAQRFRAGSGLMTSPERPQARTLFNPAIFGGSGASTAHGPGCLAASAQCFCAGFLGKLRRAPLGVILACATSLASAALMVSPVACGDAVTYLVNVTVRPGYNSPAPTRHFVRGRRPVAKSVEARRIPKSWGMSRLTSPSPMSIRRPSSSVRPLTSCVQNRFGRCGIRQRATVPRLSG